VTWISLKERLPSNSDLDVPSHGERRGDFLIAWKSADWWFRAVATFYRYTDGEEFFGGYDPSHWMPLPDPPKEIK
jgi:hypothetical protein